VYPGFLQHTGFVAMNPDHHAKSHFDYFKDLLKGDETSAESHRKFYDEYNAVLDMDADYYLETISTVFQDFKLVNGTWDVKGVDGKIERVRPQDIKTTALLTVEGELDDISGSGQTQAAHGLCANIPADQQKHLEAQGAGHYGIFSGSRWRKVVYPAVKSFILEHALKAPTTKPALTPVSNLAPKAASTPVSKSVAKPITKPAAKPSVKAVPKAAAKPAAKQTVKPMVKAAAPKKTGIKKAAR
jgi:poly(3-hydroxybutyrate) depolymerase